MAASHTPECYQAPNEGTHPFGCPVINTIPHEDIVKWHNIMVDARENATELLRQHMENITMLGKIHVNIEHMYEKEIEELNEAIINLRTYL